MNETYKVGNSEVSLENGLVDEIIIKDNDGKCIFHLEQMDDDIYWSAIYSNDKTVVINFSSDKPIIARITEGR
jgi:hypothetical protein